MNKYVLLSPTGHLFIISPFGYYWKFEGINSFGYWKNRSDMVKYYKEVFGFQFLGKL